MISKLISIFLILISAYSAFIQECCADIYDNNRIINVINIDNFSKVDDDYYRGAQPTFNDLVSLSMLGIKTIINLRDFHSINDSELQKQKYAAQLLGINLINIPMRPDIPPNTKQISLFFSIINNQNNLPVFVHCAQGKDRTGIMTALYRINKYGWNFEQAYSEMRKKGYHHVLYPRQKSFLAQYTKQLNYTDKLNQPTHLLSTSLKRW